MMNLLEKAYNEQRVLHITYHAKYEEPLIAERDIEVYKYDNIYISAYCRLLKGMRNFRIDRITDIELIDEYFEIDHNILEQVDEEGWAGKSEEWVKNKIKELFWHGYN